MSGGETATRTPRRRRAPGRVAHNFYRNALDQAGREDLEAAAEREGLDDEVALLRMLVRRELAAEPADMKLVLQSMTLLLRAVGARYKLAPEDQSALEERIVDAVRALTASIEEGAVDG